MYIRDTAIIIVRPGDKGQIHVEEGFHNPSKECYDLLPTDEEINNYRVIVPEKFPDSIKFSMIGKKIKEIMEIPEYQGFCPVRGNNLGGDILNSIQDNKIIGIREIGRGTIITISQKKEI